jgi:hypothetical protein
VVQGEYVREEGEKQLQQLTHDQPARVCTCMRCDTQSRRVSAYAHITAVRCRQEAMMRIRKAREAAAAETYAADVRAQAERQVDRCAYMCFCNRIAVRSSHLASLR